MKKNKLPRPLKSLYDLHNIEPRKRKDMNLVIFSFAMVMVYMPITMGTPLTGFAQLLGAGDFFYSVIFALPILGNVVQIFSSLIIEKTRKRKVLFIVFGVIHRFMWILIGVVPMLIIKNGGTSTIPYIIFFMVISSVCASFVGGGFFSWMGDLIPAKMLGKYLGYRESLGTLVGLVATLLVSIYLDSNSTLTGFSNVFIVGGIFGIIDILSFIFVTNSPMHESEHPKLIPFIKKALKDKAFMKYIIFWSLWSFAFNMASPFYNVYAIGMLALTFVQVAIAGQMAYSLTSAFASPRWGGILDKYGIKYVIKRAGLISAVVSIVMLFSSRGNMVPLLIFSLLNGLTLTAINTTSSKMLMTTTPAKNRSMYIAIYALTTSLCAIIGFLSGGALLEVLGDINISLLFIQLDRYKLIFIISGALRALVIIGYLPVMAKIIKEDLG